MFSSDGNYSPYPLHIHFSLRYIVRKQRTALVIYVSKTTCRIIRIIIKTMSTTTVPPVLCATDTKGKTFRVRWDGRITQYFPHRIAKLLQHNFFSVTAFCLF